MGWLAQATTGAQRADRIFMIVLALAVFLLFCITATMICFVIRYDRKRHPKAEQIEGNTWLEVGWTILPLVVFVAIFYFGWTNYEYIHDAPPGALTVKITARQWAWSFQYPNGKQTPVLYAALGRPVKLEARTLDVIHGFFVPAFRLKMDVLPGHVATTWFQPTLQGSFVVECTVMCGIDHSSMMSKVVVVPEADFRRWYFGDEDAPPPRPEASPPPGAEPPGLLALRRNNCLACHSLDGSVMVGPTFRGMLGRREEILDQGRTRTIVVDERRLRASIRSPGARPLKGYPDVMPQSHL
jgi:cytochrome c oxidase subunit 2